MGLPSPLRASGGQFPSAQTVIQEGIAEGLHPGAQLYVSRRGEVLIDAAFGEARLGTPMQTGSILLCLSSGKPFTAVAIAQLCERGQLSLDTRVASVLPEFGEAGKGAISVRHLLTHTGGIRTADKCDAGMAWDEIIECICRTAPEAHTGAEQRAAYHPSASWYILGEIVRRLDGRPLDQYLRQELFAPCGLSDTWMALPPDQFDRYGNRLAWMYLTERQPPTPHHRWNTSADAAVCRPGRNARAPMRELGRFYEELLRVRRRDESTPGAERSEVSDERRQAWLNPASARELTRRQRVGLFDDTFQQVIDWGFGFMIDSKRHGREKVSYGYGRFASDEAFGHGGSQSSSAFADPAYDLVVAWGCNGLPGERRHQQRAHQLNTAIYQDLGLTGGG